MMLAAGAIRPGEALFFVNAQAAGLLHSGAVPQA